MYIRGYVCFTLPEVALDGIYIKDSLEFLVDYDGLNIFTIPDIFKFFS